MPSPFLEGPPRLLKAGLRRFACFRVLPLARRIDLGGVLPSRWPCPASFGVRRVNGGGQTSVRGVPSGCSTRDRSGNAPVSGRGCWFGRERSPGPRPRWSAARHDSSRLCGRFSTSRLCVQRRALPRNRSPYRAILLPGGQAQVSVDLLQPFGVRQIRRLPPAMFNGGTSTVSASTPEVPSSEVKSSSKDDTFSSGASTPASRNSVTSTRRYTFVPPIRSKAPARG